MLLLILIIILPKILSKEEYFYYLNHPINAIINNVFTLKGSYNPKRKVEYVASRISDDPKPL